MLSDDLPALLLCLLSLLSLLCVLVFVVCACLCLCRIVLFSGGIAIPFTSSLPYGAVEQ